MRDPIAWYDANAKAAAADYETAEAEDIHGWLLGLLPPARATILDVGAGSGRDAAWLASRGYDVVAVEPSAAMRDEALRRHPGTTVRWIGDTLPVLDTVTRSGLSFDLILLSAVWMHVAPTQRARAFRKLVNLLRPGGLIAITLRHGPGDPERGMHPVSTSELEALARDHGASVQRIVDAPDQLGRTEVRWTQVAIRLPDDGTGALPLLRHVILNDDKSSTYKLALLRTLCRIADGSAGLGREGEDGFVSVPLGLVALTWVRLFKPLLAAGLPQSPANAGYSRLGFVKDAFRQLDGISHLDLRVGMSFTGDAAAALNQALKDAAETIARMPATYITLPDGAPIFPVNRSAGFRRPASLRLDEAYLRSFGELRIPGHLWRALQRFDAWIEPALVSEWTRMIKVYAGQQGRSVEDATIINAMIWSEPSRDVRVARLQAVRALDRGHLYCVWTGQSLSAQTVDIDHCLPWSAWSCGDLWNLLPVHRRVNQHEKRDRLPGDRILEASRERILSWWAAAYMSAEPVLAERFELEATSSLPSLPSTSFDLGDTYEALCLQRMRLKHDQQVPEWIGQRYL